MAPPSSIVPADHVRDKIVTQIYVDPGLPRANPTIPAWQLPPHPLANVQSPSLAPETDYVIIGSGITGCSVAKNLLENAASGSKSVTVLEARTLAGGATSRNAGFLLSHAPKNFKKYCETFGVAGAKSIAEYCERTLDLISKLVVEAGPDAEQASEKRKVRGIIVFKDEQSLADQVASVRMYEKAFPEQKGLYSVIDRNEASQKYHLKDAAGALSVDAFVFWPYRLITRVYQSLMDRYKSRLRIETGTPVTSIVYSPDTSSSHPYIIATSRGTIRAKTVLHCENAFTSHLVPSLRGKVYPVRLSMSTQDRAQFPNHGAEFCWMFYGTRGYEAATGFFEPGMDFMQQNARTGELFFGGGKQRMEDIVTADDSEVSSVTKKSISTRLPTIFRRGWQHGSRPQVKEMWSGIIACTPDGLPLVGRVPDDAVNGDGGQWVAAGFNGYGMALCWSSGEAIAKMALGEEAPEWLPRLFLTNKRRLQNAKVMGPNAAFMSLL